MDASALATKAALATTILPCLSVEKGDEGVFEVSLTDDPLDGTPLEISPPLTVTVAKLGLRYVVDPTDEEETVANAHVIVSVNVRDFLFLFIFISRSIKT